MVPLINLVAPLPVQIIMPTHCRLSSMEQTAILPGPAVHLQILIWTGKQMLPKSLRLIMIFPLLHPDH